MSRTDHGKGRISRRLLAFAALASLLLLVASTAVPVDASEDEYVEVVTPKLRSRVYVYAGPGTHYGYIGFLPSGRTLPVCSKSMYWIGVCLEHGTMGYIYAPFAMTYKVPRAEAEPAAEVIEVPAGEVVLPPEKIPDYVQQQQEVEIVEPPAPKVEAGEVQPVEPAIEQPPPEEEPVEPLTFENAPVEEEGGQREDYDDPRAGEFRTTLGGSVGPLGVGNDPAAFESGSGWSLAIDFAYNFRPWHTSEAHALRLGVFLAAMISFAQESEDVLELVGRDESFGPAGLDMFEIGPGLAFCPHSGRLFEWMIRVAPLYYRFNYYQNIRHDVILEGKEEFSEGREDFYVRNGIGYAGGMRLAFHPFYASLNRSSGLSVGLDGSFHHYAYAYSETLDNRALIGELYPKFFVISLTIGYGF